jgi:NADH:ubiquinone oxidoreductase subunit
MNDGSGTIDRGNIGGTFTANGTVSYYGFSSYYPYDIDSAFVRIDSVDVSGGPWDSSDYNETDGSFSATVDADSSVGQDTYTFYFYQSGTARTDTSTDTYIADRVVVRQYNSTSAADPYVKGWPTPHIDVSGDYVMFVELEYEYDNTDVSTGTWTESSLSLSYDIAGKWEFTEDANTPALYTYNTVAGSDTTHGISGVNQNSKQLQLIGDRIILMASRPHPLQSVRERGRI